MTTVVWIDARETMATSPYPARTNHRIFEINVVEVKEHEAKAMEASIPVRNLKRAPKTAHLKTLERVVKELIGQ